MFEVAQNEGQDNNINIVLHHVNCNNDKGSANIYKKIISLRYCTSSPTRVIYQMGHLLGLFKTQQGTSNSGSIPLLDPPCITDGNYEEAFDKLFLPNFNGNSENITRDIANPDYNADTAGDMVADTPACFRGSEHNFCHKEFPYSTWEFIENPSIVDNSSEHLMYQDVDLFNFMSLMYSYLPPLNSQHFTNGQGVRMRETIAIPSLNFDAVSTSIDALYEPYKNTYYGAGPTLPNHRPLFQPGFDYYFVPCSGDYNEPSDYNDVSFNFSINNLCDDCIINKNSLDLNSITHPNHTAVFINQLNINDLRHGGQPRKCYNNNNRTANSGEVIKFVDNIPNTNVIIDSKDQQEINDENLIQNLDSGLYIIKKNYDDGTQEQQTINKSGN
jgi:hypothetical protein